MAMEQAQTNQVAPVPVRHKGMARAIGSLDSEANRGFEVGRYHCGGRHGPAYSAQLPLAGPCNFTGLRPAHLKFRPCVQN